MKKKRKNLIFITLLVVCLMGAMHVIQGIQAKVYAQIPTVSNFSQLYSALIQAEDGDVIGINGIITISGDATVGYTDKHITLKRMSSSSYFNIGSSTTFQNLTIDGGGISSTNAFVLTNGNVTFQDVTFENSVNTHSGGGAVHVINNIANFNNCTFDNNTSLEGGHIFVNNASAVKIENSILMNGHASISGGAVMNSYYEATTNITNSVITENSADGHGGGISNRGNMIITGTKIFDNTASNGADIANVTYGNLNLADSIESLVELFEDDGILPKAWVNDYDGSSISDPDIDPTATNSLLKLDYEILPTEVILEPDSLGTADDGKVTGLESGKHYIVTMDDVISYSKADGSLTISEAEASPLVGTEIIGLTNGETYLVEEFTPAPTTVLIDSASLGTADSGKITGLTAGEMYKVSVDGTTNYTLADGTLSSNESEAEALTGTEIIALTNGLTYLVEEYTPPVEESPIEEEPIEPTEPTEPPIEEEQEEEEEEEEEEETPIEEIDQEELEEETSTDQEEEIETDQTTEKEFNETEQDLTNSQDQTSSSRTDISDLNPSSNSIVNNYLYADDRSIYTQNNQTDSLNQSNKQAAPTSANSPQTSATQEQTIKIDAASLVPEGVNIQEDGNGLIINVNVNVGSDTNGVNDAGSKEPVQIEPENNFTWVEVTQICLLFGIFICVFRKP